MDLLEKLETLRGVIRMRRQSEVHGDYGRLVASQLGDGRFAIACDNGLVLLERPLHLLLQRGVVFDDQQGLARLTHTTSLLASGAKAAPSACGNSTRMFVPLPGALSTRM